MTAIELVAKLFTSIPVRQRGAMFWSALAHLVALLLDLSTARRQPACAKDLAIAVLRHL